ncbi:Protein disulfide-isomerase tigA; Flags: Precursor [Serendipita indica DSM 11827]|nr:Protein disulfide-isomerase tigA; Flags: Precursor [Serendipita indica DSM 11827]
MKLSLLLLGFLPIGVWASNVLELTESDFDKHVGAGKPPALVEFGHCKNLAPTYEKLGDAFSHAKDKVSIVKVDADGKGKALGSKYGVTGFPTLKWFNGDGSEPEAYNGGRELEELASFVTKKTGVKSSIKPPPPAAVITADVDTFKEIVMDPKKDVLVAFTAPWCGHCKNMKPALEAVAQTFKPENDCIIVNIDADAQQNKGIAREFSVNSFPTIKFFPRANSPFTTTPLPADTVGQATYTKYGKHAIPYEKARSEADFVAFLNQHCGTNRAVGGGLNTFAGRLTGTWDSWAQELMGFASQKTEDAKARMVEIVNLMKAGLDEVKAEEQFAARWYIRASEKIVNNTESWLEKESKRLNSILAKKSLAQTKLDEVRIKANILTAFVVKRGEEVADDIKEKVQDVKEKVEQKAAQVKEEL